MGSGPGGPGLTPSDPNGVAEGERNAATTNNEGVNITTEGDHRVECRNINSQSEGYRWLEVKGASGKNFVGAYYEASLGLKHSLTGGFKTSILIDPGTTWTYGPYLSEMLAIKYEIIRGKKETIVHLKKTDTYTGAKWERVDGKWTSATAAKRQKSEALEKEINDVMTQRVGAMLEETAAKYEAKAKSVREKINDLDLKVVGSLRVKCDKARETVRELERHLSNIEYHCGKFERKAQAMDESISALMEFKGSSNACKANMLKVKGSVLKFTGSAVKLGE